MDMNKFLSSKSREWHESLAKLDATVSAEKEMQRLGFSEIGAWSSQGGVVDGILISTAAIDSGVRISSATTTGR